MITLTTIIERETGILNHKDLPHSRICNLCTPSLINAFDVSDIDYSNSLEKQNFDNLYMFPVNIHTYTVTFIESYVITLPIF